MLYLHSKHTSHQEIGQAEVCDDHVETRPGHSHVGQQANQEASGIPKEGES